MGIAYVRGKVSKPAGGRTIGVRFLVDTGAVYTVLPERIWKPLRLKSRRSVEFTLADGTLIVRPVSECRVAISGVDATSPVVLGERDDGPLLGAVTLETLGLMVNPLSRTLLPMRMTLAPLPAAGLPPSAGCNPVDGSTAPPALQPSLAQQKRSLDDPIRQGRDGNARGGDRGEPHERLEGNIRNRPDDWSKGRDASRNIVSGTWTR